MILNSLSLYILNRSDSNRKALNAVRLLEQSAVIVFCKNSKCQREIKEPILLTNLSVTPAEHYDVCPYCFTKLQPKTIIRQEVTPSAEMVLEKDEDSGFQALKKVEDLIRGTTESKEKDKENSGCPEIFGYLANRPKDTHIHQECLLCPKIVECMLKVKE